MIDPEEALRLVRVAIWHEGMQGQSGWYALKLSCGHDSHCSLGMLRASLICLECLRELLRKKEEASE